MNAPHRIRLHGPWDYDVFAVYSATSDVVVGSRGRFQLPDGWANALGEDFTGAVRLTRRFNRPTGLGAHNRIWLVIEGVDDLSSAWLNDHVFDEIDTNHEAEYDLTWFRTVEWDITARLSDRNLLTLDIARTNMTGPLLTGVRLEIRDP